jgi:hypothetical protein
MQNNKVFAAVAQLLRQRSYFVHLLNVITWCEILEGVEFFIRFKC